jgi:hypothetical protein
LRELLRENIGAPPFHRQRLRPGVKPRYQIAIEKLVRDQRSDQRRTSGPEARCGGARD